MNNKYLIKIEDSILPQSFTFDQLIDAGLLDNVDEKIKVKLESDSVWITARNYPFSEVENKVQNEAIVAHGESHSLTQQVRPTVSQSNRIRTSNATQQRVRESQRTIPIDRAQQRPVNPLPTTPSILDTWNWGAFCLSWIWGVCNGIYWPLLIIVCNFIPYIGLLLSLGICMCLGLKGNVLAWNVAQKGGKSPIEFENIQSIWNIVGIILFFGTITIGLFAGLIFLF